MVRPKKRPADVAKCFAPPRGGVSCPRNRWPPACPPRQPDRASPGFPECVRGAMGPTNYRVCRKNPGFHGPLKPRPRSGTGHVADIGAQALGVLEKIMPLHLRFAGVRRQKADEHFDGGAFTGAIAA